MKKLYFLLLLLPLFLQAQVVTTNPTVVTTSGVVEIIFNAAEGNQGLKDYAGDEVFAHTGLITDSSTGGSDWKYAPAWGDNADKYKMTSLGDNLWKLTISPDIKTYYGAADSDEVLKLAFVFRDGTSSKEAKGEGNSDIFVTLNEEVFTPTPPITRSRPSGVTDGINYVDDHTVTLVLYAPGKEHVHLLGDFNDWKKDNDCQLYKDGDYWWYTVTGLEKNKEYGFQYLVNNSLKIADAYAQKVLDPLDTYIPSSIYPNLKSYPVQTEGIVAVMHPGKPSYQWQTINYTAPKADQLIIYEILVRDFTNEGSINAVTAKLDYLKELGVNAIELMPVQEFAGNDSWGYNPTFFFAADKAYGTEDAYKNFIEEAHKRGIAVILDVVFNHAADDHPFVKLYWDGNRPAANNPWLNQEAPHPYSVFYDFNHEKELTRTYFKKVITHWLNEYKLDGFRFDLTKGFTQKESTEATAGKYDASRIAILKDYHAAVQAAKPGAYTILEHFCESQEEEELAKAGMYLWNNMNHAYCQSIMGYASESDLSGGYGPNRGWDINNLITYQESHDEERTMYKAQAYGAAGIKGDLVVQLQRAAMNTAFLFCTPGPKMIWQFGELGYDYSINYNIETGELNSRTGRKPVKWDYLDVPERTALLDKYVKLLNLRAKYPNTFSSPTTVEMDVNTISLQNGRRIALTHPDMDLVLVGNYLSTQHTMNPDFPSTGTWRELFTGETVSGSSVTLPAHSFKLFVNQKDIPTSGEKINPTSDLRIQIDGNKAMILTEQDVKQISVFTVNGKLLKVAGNTKEIDLSGTENGILLFIVRTDGDVTSQFVKK